MQSQNCIERSISKSLSFILSQKKTQVLKNVAWSLSYWGNWKWFLLTHNNSKKHPKLSYFYWNGVYRIFRSSYRKLVIPTSSCHSLNFILLSSKLRPVNTKTEYFSQTQLSRASLKLLLTITMPTNF